MLLYGADPISAAVICESNPWEKSDFSGQPQCRQQGLRLARGSQGGTWDPGEKAFWSAVRNEGGTGQSVVKKEAVGEGGHVWTGWGVDTEREGLLSRKERPYSSAKRMVCKSVH